MKTLFAACAMAVAAGTACAGPYSDFSLILSGDYTSTSEVEGRSFIGGGLYGPASNYGVHLNAGAYLGVDTLLVGGNVHATNIQVNAGNTRVGGSAFGNINMNGGGTSTLNDASVAGQVGSLYNTFANASAYLSGLAGTGSLSLPGGQPSPVTFTATPGSGGFSVINIAASDLFSNGLVQTINLNLAGASSLVINVSGTSVDFTTGGNFAGSFANDDARSRVLWNFYEAETINLRGKAFEGALLAPNAFVEHQGVISGLVVAESMNSMSEIHLPGYQGVLPSPGSMALLGMGGLVASRRRRA